MKITELSPLVRRITADNGGVFTGGGTNTYLVGHQEITVIDPGPASKEHIENIVKVCGEDIKQILVTHTHNDHSPGAKLLHQRTAAPVMGMYALNKEMQDPTFKANKVLEDGDEIIETEYSLKAIHTPGHASNHLCFLLEKENLIFTGDHIMDGSTVVIAPPDGNMKEYLNSLEILKKIDLKLIAPGHGNLMENPYSVVDWIVSHRMYREKKVVDAISEVSIASLDELLNIVYDDVDKNLLAIAKYSLLAHLNKLIEDERVEIKEENYYWKG
ncbi:MAG: MBL fold metallo-hydrolase [Gammaproteobacteria bacterium]|tara:strand:+ start:95 stop:910 length:816 start_codon:yes stop_codon:yes gene_type:complete